MNKYKDDLKISRDSFLENAGTALSRAELEELVPVSMSYRGRSFVRSVLDGLLGGSLRSSEKADPADVAERITKEIEREEKRVTSYDDISDELIRYIQAEVLRSASHKMDYDERYPVSTLNNYASDVEDGYWS